MKCANCEKAFTDYLSGEMNPERTAKFEAHLEKCKKCRDEFKDFKKTWAKLADALNSEKLPELKLECSQRKKILDKPASAKISTSKFKHYPTTLKFAAAIILGVFIGLIAMPLFRKQIAREAFPRRYIHYKTTEKSYEAVKRKMMHPKAASELRTAIPIASKKSSVSVIKSKTDAAEKEIIECEEPVAAPVLVNESNGNIQVIRKGKPQYKNGICANAEITELKKVYFLDFSRNNIKSEKDFEAFLKKHNMPMPSRVKLDFKENKVTIHACPEMMRNLDEFFKKINAPAQKLDMPEPEQKKI
ncbi:zf-HC2 domain-containing protein [Lentisphaerota bacterium ZTH]|nr:zf-HC2 domain-containing protein [Lentisphaerota bacterium]WET06214.1 zf-HC2 domain-containing protein [Lentisphaerota bacterium ZTH]